MDETGADGKVVWLGLFSLRLDNNFENLRSGKSHDYRYLIAPFDIPDVFHRYRQKVVE
jgi:hypothetical protein